jgi:hypothetical protein
VWAQQVKIAFHDGQVSVDSNGAPPRAILAEWSKVGGTNIVNAERVIGAPLTLKLVDVPEAQALEIILRSVAGYMAAAARTHTRSVTLRSDSRAANQRDCGCGRSSQRAPVARWSALRSARGHATIRAASAGSNTGR